MFRTIGIPGGKEREKETVYLKIIAENFSNVGRESVKLIDYHIFSMQEDLSKTHHELSKIKHKERILKVAKGKKDCNL